MSVPPSRPLVDPPGEAVARGDMDVGTDAPAPQPLRTLNSADAALRARAGRQDPAEQVQIKNQGDGEHQAPPTSRGAEYNDATVIQTASSSRITSGNFRCRRSQLIACRTLLASGPGRGTPPANDPRSGTVLVSEYEAANQGIPVFNWDWAFDGHTLRTIRRFPNEDAPAELCQHQGLGLTSFSSVR